MMKALRVLLVSDSISTQSSGGLVVNRIIDLLLSEGANVVVLSQNLDSKTHFRSDVKVVSLGFSALDHILPSKQALTFEKIINEFRPDIVHWCSLDYFKSRSLISIAKKFGARTIAQPWVYNFFCAQGYNYKDETECNQCLPNSFYKSVIHSCGDSHIRTIQAVSRALYKLDILKFDRFLSTNTVMDEVLTSYGISKDNIVRCALPFDKNRLDYLIPMINENIKSFVFYGQFREFKGAYQIKEIAARTKDSTVRFDIYSAFKTNNDKGLISQNLYEHLNVEVHDNYSWSSGLDKKVASSLGIILPSMWPTTTEYVLLEAMTLCKPVVAYNVGAHKDILCNRENAMVIEPGNIEQFCAAVEELNKDLELRRHLGRGALNTINQLYSQNSTLRSLRAAYLI
jgi:glycosyltransferase involved in cell wall biosynthesis